MTTKAVDHGSGDRSPGRRGQVHRTGRRAPERRPVELPVTVEDAANRVRGRIRFDTADHVVGGAFLRSDLLFEVDEEVDIAFTLPHGARVHARGRVVRVSRERDDGRVPGMGIKFITLSEPDREAVRAFISKT